MSYTTFQRWHASWDAPFIETNWRLTDLPFVEGQVLLGARLWMQDQVRYLRVGEVPVWADARTQRGLVRIPAVIKGKHICHPEWFATGEPWPTSLPDTVYGPDGFPLCCMEDVEPVAGGMELGGEIQVHITRRISTAGGIEVGGAVQVRAAQVTPAAGGLSVGGAMSVTANVVVPVSGGVENGGEVGVIVTYAPGVGGGMGIGGEVGVSAAAVLPTAGGVEIGGAVSVRAAITQALAGGVEIGGAVAVHAAITAALAGGVEIGGAIGVAARAAVPLAGGVEVGGAISVTQTSFLLLDHFVDTNGTTLPTHLMDIGPGGPNTTGWNNQNGSWWIQSNQAVQTGALSNLNFGAASVANATSSAGNIYATLTAPASGTWAGGVVARVASAGNWYQWYYNKSAGWMGLIYQNGSSVTFLATPSFTWAAGATHTIRLSISGTTLRGYVDGTLLATATDSHLASSNTNWGIETYVDGVTFTTRPTFSFLGVTG